MLLHVVVPGPPVGKQRPRVTFQGGRAHAYTPQRTQDWEMLAAGLMRQAYRGPCVEGPLSLSVVAVAIRPQRLMRLADYPGRILRTTKPDGDNVLKCCADALQRADVIRDDCHIALWTCVGYYASKDEGPHVVIQLAKIDTLA